MRRNYQRPPWTCGRYDEHTHSALLYNLLEGKSFFFEDETADLIGCMLTYDRESVFSLAELCAKSGIEEDSLLPFCELLCTKGLLANQKITEIAIEEYRAKILVQRNRKLESDSLVGNHDNMDFLVPNSSNAEKMYSERVGSAASIVLFELTYNCSERCVHCYNPGATRNESEQNQRGAIRQLTLSDYYRIIDEFYAEGTTRVCLSGGDPFSNVYVWQIIEYLYKKEIAIEIFTNAQKIVGCEKRLCSFFPCVVGVSIYSSVAEVHDSITRIKGSFDKSISVLENLHRLGQVLEIKCCVMQQNLKTYTGVKDIAERYNATFQMECAIFDSADGDKSISKYLRLTEEQLEVVLRDSFNPLYVGPELSNYGGVPKDLSDIACKAGISGIAVAPDGTLIPCASFHASLGSLKEKSLHDLLYENDYISWWTDQTLSKYEECGRHDYCDFCKMCPGLNFAEHGTPLKAAENNCFVAKVRYNLMSKLVAGQDPLKGHDLQCALNGLSIDYRGDIKREPSDNNYNKPINYKES